MEEIVYKCPECGSDCIVYLQWDNPFDPDSCQCEDCGYQDYPENFVPKENA